MQKCPTTILSYLNELEDTIYNADEMLQELYVQYEVQTTYIEQQVITTDIAAYELAKQNARREATRALIKHKEYRYYVDGEMPSLQKILRRIQMMRK